MTNVKRDSETIHAEFAAFPWRGTHAPKMQASSTGGTQAASGLVVDEKTQDSDSDPVCFTLVTM
eukprot:7381285-Prymnesium_polylepis.1